MSDIVERLNLDHSTLNPLHKEAADEITRLRQLLSEADKREKEVRAKALNHAAVVAYATCAESLHGHGWRGLWLRSGQGGFDSIGIIDCEISDQVPSLYATGSVILLVFANQAGKFFYTGANRPANGQDITLHMIRTIISCVYPNVEVTAGQGALVANALAALPLAIAFNQIATIVLDNITMTAV